MKSVLLYSSKTGYTKRYAHHIADELSLEAYPLNAVGNLQDVLSGKEILLYGGGLYASGIDGLLKLSKQYDLSLFQHVIIFCTGLSIPSEEITKELTIHNLDPLHHKNATLFYYRGGFDYRRLGRTDQLLMQLLKLKIELKKKIGKQLLNDEKGMLAVFHRQVDFTKTTSVKELLEHYRSIQSKIKTDIVP